MFNVYICLQFAPLGGRWSNPIWWACVLNLQLGVSIRFDWWVGLFKNMIQGFSMVLKMSHWRPALRYFISTIVTVILVFLLSRRVGGYGMEILIRNPVVLFSCGCCLFLFFRFLFGFDSRPIFFPRGGGGLSRIPFLFFVVFGLFGFVVLRKRGWMCF